MKRAIWIAGSVLAGALVFSGGVHPGHTGTLAAATIGAPALIRAHPVQSEGEQILQTRCAVCHDLGGVDEFQASYDEDSLRELIATMVSYGAQVTEEETNALVAYLLGGQVATSFDEAAAGDLVNSRCTTCHDLTGIERGIYTAQEWEETVNRMMGYGLTLTDEEFDLITTYLGTAPGAADAGAGLDEAAAADLINSRCTTCHDLTAVERGLYTAEEWGETVSRMMGYGLALTDEEFDLITAYLGSSPEDEAGDYDAAAAEVLLNTSCTTCHDLSAVTAEPGAYTEDQFRETIFRMMGYGLVLEDAQVETLVRYLTETYGAQ